MDTAIIGSSKNAMAATEPVNTGNFFTKKPAKAPNKNGNKPETTAPAIRNRISTRAPVKYSVSIIRKATPSPIQYRFSLPFLNISYPLFLAIPSTASILIQFASGPSDCADDKLAEGRVCVGLRAVAKLDSADLCFIIGFYPADSFIAIGMVGGQ